MYMHRGGEFQNQIPQGGYVYNYWIFVIQIYTLHLARICRFSCRGPENRKGIVLWATITKLLNKLARTKIFQLVSEVTQIITFSHLWGSPTFWMKIKLSVSQYRTNSPIRSGTRIIWSKFGSLRRQQLPCQSFSLLLCYPRNGSDTTTPSCFLLIFLRSCTCTGVVSFKIILHVRSYDLGMLFRFTGRKLRESNKWRFSTILLRILVPSIMNWCVHLSSKNFHSINCAFYSRELWDITYILSAIGLECWR